MPPGTVAVLAHHLRSLDPAAASQLVADIWAARGFETATHGTLVAATRVDRTVNVHAGPYHGRPSDVDVVVDLGDRSSVRNGVRVLNATETAEMLRYALDPAECRALCRRHLGKSPETLQPPIRTRLRNRYDGIGHAVPVMVVASLLLLVAGTIALGHPAGSTQAIANDSAEEPTDFGEPRSLSATTSDVEIPPPSYPSNPPREFRNESIGSNESSVGAGTS